MIRLSKKLQSLPPYLFVEIDRAKRKARAEGRDIIDLGIGDPDQPTPSPIVEALCRGAQDPASHRYALDAGMPVLREEIAGWFSRRFGVALDPATQILPTIGSKEAIAHLPLAFLDPGDISLVPDPCYPPYRNGAILAGGVPYLMPLKESNHFLCDLEAIPASVLKQARLLYVNYPNNPTSAVADIHFYRQVIDFALSNKLLVVSDLAYSEMAYDGYQPPSILEVDGASEVAIEFHSFSKTYNMTGWRVGWACGNPALVSALGKVKSNIDSGIFMAVQAAAVAALKGAPAYIAAMRALYQERRDTLIQGLASLGWKVFKPQATFYVWIQTPGAEDSISYAAKLLEKADIVVTPGVGFGASGEGYIRMALTVPSERLNEALERLKKL